jgi:hypothetical protein
MNDWKKGDWNQLMQQKKNKTMSDYFSGRKED